MPLGRHRDHAINIANRFIKVLSSLMVALLVVSFPAQARVKDQLEDAVMKCMTDPSKMTCERAAESAGIDAKRVYNSN